MDTKEFRFDDEARRELLNGALVIYKAVGATLGPRGRTVLIDRYPDTPRVTKDGVTVAKEVVLEHTFENMGAQMVREAAKQTSDEAGDGTTTATVYAASILQEGMKLLATGGNPAQIQKGINLAVKEVVEFYRDVAVPVEGVEQVMQVGACAANQDQEIGRKIADAMDRVGKDGMVNVEEGTGIETEVDMVTGVQFEHGFMDPRFANEATGRAVYDDVAIVLCDRKLNVGKNLLPVLEWSNRTKPSTPILLIVQDAAGAGLMTALGNKQKFGVPIVVVKAPYWGDKQKEFWEDMACLTGATIFSAETGQDIATLAFATEADQKKTGAKFGRAERVVVDRDSTTIIKPRTKTEELEKRVEMIRHQLDEGNLSPYDTEKAQVRLARLTGGIANIKVGAPTEVELKELKDRVEDALHACRAAVEEGVLPGGAVAPFYARERLKTLMEQSGGDLRAGVQIVYNSLNAPLALLAENAAKQPGEVISRLEIERDRVAKEVESWIVVEDQAVGGNGVFYTEAERQAAKAKRLKESYHYGWNAATDAYGNMTKMGVIVPLKVERVALEKAASVASVLLGTAVCIAAKQEEESGLKLTP